MSKESRVSKMGGSLFWGYRESISNQFSSGFTLGLAILDLLYFDIPHGNFPKPGCYCFLRALSTFTILIEVFLARGTYSRNDTITANPCSMPETESPR